MKIRFELEVDVEFGFDNDLSDTIDRNTVTHAIVEVIHSEQFVDNLVDTVSERVNWSISSLRISTPEIECVE